MQKQSLKLEFTQKTEQDTPCRKILTFDQRSTQKVKVTQILVKSIVRAHGSDLGGLGRVGRINGQLGDEVLTRRHY